MRDPSIPGDSEHGEAEPVVPCTLRFHQVAENCWTISVDDADHQLQVFSKTKQTMVSAGPSVVRRNADGKLRVVVFYANSEQGKQVSIADLHTWNPGMQIEGLPSYDQKTGLVKPAETFGTRMKKLLGW